jgi:adenylate kinase family enzyme
VALGVIAEAAASGRSTSIISSNAEAKRWLEFLEDEGVPKNRPFRRLNIAGEAGVGKTTLANEIGPLLGLPVVSVDDVFWNNEETRNKGADGRRQQVNQILAKERWLAEGVYWRTAARLSAAADATLHLDFPSSRIRDQRDARGRPTRPLKEKVIVSTFVFAYPVIYERRLRRALSEIAHRGPIFEVRNDEELEAVRAGLVKGAGVAAADGPVGTE